MSREAYETGVLPALLAAQRKERRERIAVAAMQGMLAHVDLQHSPGFHIRDLERVATMSVSQADALIAELDK